MKNMGFVELFVQPLKVRVYQFILPVKLSHETFYILPVKLSQETFYFI